MITETHHFVASAAEAGVRLDRYISLQLQQCSRAFIQKLIDSSNVTVNDKLVRRSYLVTEADRITVMIPEATETDLQPENIPLDIIFEDRHLLVVNKPAGMIVHPGAGIHSGTLVNALMYYCQDLSGIGGRLRPGIVHRLDKNTSGLLAIAKNDIAHRALQEQFSSKTAYREYKALVWGLVQEKEQTIESFLNRSKSDRKKFAVSSEGKMAITKIEVEEYFQFLTLLRIQLQTGRTHQIRVHCKHLQHPVFGDPDYSGRNNQLGRLSTLSDKNFAIYLLKLMTRQALHAHRLGFIHPATGEAMSFSAELPADFDQVIKRVKQYEGLPS